MIRKLVLGIGVLGLLAGCSTTADDARSAESAAAVSETPGAPAPIALDCSQHGSFDETAMKGVGDGTYVRAGTAPSNGLKTFTLGPLQDIPGWAGKNADYTRDIAAPCLDFKALGDGTGVQKGAPLPMTESGCDGQKGKATVIMDNPAIGAFISFEDQSGLPAGRDAFFITASKMEPSGKISALCLINATTGDHFLATRQ